MENIEYEAMNPGVRLILFGVCVFFVWWISAIVRWIIAVPSDAVRYVSGGLASLMVLACLYLTVVAIYEGWPVKEI